MRLISIHKRSGFTLIEFIMAIALMAILSVLSVNVVTNTLNDARYDTTVRRLKQVRRAMVGETQIKFGQKRSDFGFLGDIGAIPTAGQGLAALVANPGLPAWTINTATRIGIAWNGPYGKGDDSDSNFTIDGWGNALVYSPAANPPSVVSLGADGAAGGTGYNADITMTLPINTRLSTVHGFIIQGGLQWSGDAEIEFNYPNGAGVLTQVQTVIVAADNGHFSFSNVPMGVRSATVYVPSKAAPTQTLGPVLFTVDQTYLALDAELFDLAPAGPTNLEVPIEMVDYGISSGIIGLFVQFERSRTSLNTTDYDGNVSYAFEIVATNLSGFAQAISIINTAGAVIATINVPNGTANPTRFRTAMTPTAGANNYRIQFPITILANQLNLYAGRIIVTQTNATKTAVYVPLISGPIAGFSANDIAAVDSTNSTTYTQAAPAAYSIWRKDSSQLSLAPANPYTLEAVLAGGLLGSANVALYNRNTNTAVAGTAIASAGLAYSLQQATFADNAANLNNTHEFELRLRSTNILQTAQVVKAGLWIRLANLGRGQTYYRIARNFSGTATPTHFDGQRALLSTAAFSNPTVYFEGVASSTSATGTTLNLIDAGTADSTTAGTTVVGSPLTWGVAKSRSRSAALTVTPGNRHFGNAQTTPGQTSNVSQETVIINFRY